MTIGFNKHAYFYDRALTRTVIARSEATRQSASQTQLISERSCKTGLCEGETDCHASLRTGSQ